MDRSKCTCRTHRMPDQNYNRFKEHAIQFAYNAHNNHLEEKRKKNSLTGQEIFPMNQEFAFFQLSSSPRLIEDETFNDSDIMNNLIDSEDGQEEPDSLRVDKICRDPAFLQIGKAFS
ncbi:hypothetical protein TNCV_2454741 [Trichonephila clavipes]|nr:hypothetical protein TNCV_2454741 [Trichonephila clavipes]